MYKKIAVPLDGSNEAEAVIPYVQHIASRFDSEVVLISVADTPVAGADNLYRYYLDRICEKVREGIASSGDGKGVEVRSEVLSGRTASEILVYANEKRISLIAMASHGRSGQGKWLLGNNAAKVLRATRCPVLLVKATPSRTAPENKSLIGRILVPLDGSAVGESAIPYAESLALALGSDMVLLQVLEPLMDWSAAEGPTASWTMVRDEVEGKRKEKALAYLEGVVAGMKKKGIGASSVVLWGRAADQIIMHSEENCVDIIAISTHGRSGLGRWVFGSVTDKILHSGSVPVLMVPANTV